MVTIREEELLTFGQVVSRLPPARSGKPMHPNTIWRWASRGLKASDGSIVKLEITKVGGRNCTSIEALERFFTKLNSPVHVRQNRSTSKDRRAKSAAEELDKIGI